MEKLLDFLSNNPVQHLSTVGLDGKPKCRPFQFMTQSGGKLWFCTSNKKEVYRELEANSALELSVCSAEGAWCRISGVARFENNIAVKEFCMAIPLIRSIYQSIENPDFEVFCIEKGRAVIADFSGNPPQIFELR